MCFGFGFYFCLSFSNLRNRKKVGFFWRIRWRSQVLLPHLILNLYFV